MLMFILIDIWSIYFRNDLNKIVILWKRQFLSGQKTLYFLILLHKERSSAESAHQFKTDIYGNDTSSADTAASLMNACAGCMCRLA